MHKDAPVTEDDYFDRYAHYEALEETIRRKPRKAPPPAASEEAAEVTNTEPGFATTYKPSRFEAVWLLSALRSFWDQSLICDVLGHVKGGKEASVYCCKAGPALQEDLLAVKVYRPRQFRNLRNDALYREGRALLTADGRPVKKTDHRIMRAVGKKTEFGMQVQHTSWLMHEYTTIESLYQAGAAVPRPIATSENAILMSYQGDAQRPAPTLSEVHLPMAEAEGLLAEALRNIELMLRLGQIHGDLSAYNILYWQEKITLIDFPQVTSVHGNKNAYFIFQRDVTRVCDYFARQGAACDSAEIMERLWERYGSSEG
jgi:RIO kinase 1